jgi:mannose-1-phosphate guanylyltransferase
MQALILVGGEGTRLRPLTSTVPKPVVPLVDRPFISYVLDWLREHGVDDVVMSCGFLAAGVRNVLGDGAAYGVRLRYVEEPRPLGTGGALKFAESLLDERFFMLNGDVLSDLDLSAQLAQHERTGARGTLALIAVDDPSGYGLVRLRDDNAIQEFVEKPSPDQIDTDLINAGAYVLDREIVSLIPPQTSFSIERDVFPELVGDGLFGFPGDGYWLDIGTPNRYLQATFDILERNVRTSVGRRLERSFLSVGDGVELEGRIVPPALVDDGCRVDFDARIGSLAVLGPGVRIGRGSTVEQAVVLQGAEIGEECRLRQCIVGAGARVGTGTRIEHGAVLGEGVTVGADNVLAHGARLFPGVTLPDGAIRF